MNETMWPFQALNKAGQAKQTAKDAADKVADALAKVENISSILSKYPYTFEFEARPCLNIV